MTDPDTHLPVEVSIFKHTDGYMFGVDSSFLSNTDEPVFNPVGGEQLEGEDFEKFCTLLGEVKTLFEHASSKYGLSHRARDKAIKVARTIADLEKSTDILQPHILEALSLVSASLTCLWSRSDTTPSLNLSRLTPELI